MTIFSFFVRNFFLNIVDIFVTTTFPLLLYTSFLVLFKITFVHFLLNKFEV